MAKSRHEEGALLFAYELNRARYELKYPLFRSAHEGYAIILEEMDELWELVKIKQKDRDYDKMRKEIIQIGAMSLAFLIEIVDTENRL
jgi:NTP pyrophosphatase (non-canonical NTP hydrolase)